MVRRSPLKCKLWDFWVLSQNSPNSSCHFSKRKPVLPQSLHHSLVLWHITPPYLFGSKIIYFWQKEEIKVQILWLPIVRIKMHQIPYVICGTKKQFLFKLCIILLCHETQLFCTVSSKILYPLDKRNPSKFSFLDF